MDDYTELAAAAFALIGQPVAAIERVAAGRNSRVFRVTTSDGAYYAVKQYATSGDRNGLDVEFAALQFLNAHGVGPVPCAVGIDRMRNMAVYGYVAGTPFDATVTQGDLDAVVDFVLELDELSRAETGWRAPAAEACFTLQNMVENINARIERLERLHAESSIYRDLHAFLEKDLSRLLDDLIRWSRGFLAQRGLSMTSELDAEERILSPSDLGFHNAVRRPDGSVVFLDFEFFGWDDVAKLTSDFLLHPAMELREEYRKRFANRLCTELRGGRFLAKRLPVAYSLVAVKWCVIMLNEFIAEHLSRRRFAGEVRDGDVVLSEQLAKAKRLCEQTADTYKDFPYGG